MAYRLAFLDKNERLEAGMAVLEHHFGNHKRCGNFCYHTTKDIDDVELVGKQYCRCKVKDAALY